VFGTAYQIDAIVQVGEAALDLFPTSLLHPPAGLAVLSADQFMGMVGASFGLGCPSAASLPTSPGNGGLLLVQQMDCFKLQAYGTGRFDFFGAPGNEHIRGSLLGLELVDISPDGLESAIECYASTVIRLGFLPKLTIPTIQITQDLLGLASVSIEPAAPVAPNPLIEADQLKAFLNATIGGSSGGGGGGGGGGHDTSGGVPRPRTRHDAFDATLAISEGTIQKVFDKIISGFVFDKSGSASFGPFSVEYHVHAHLHGGSLDLRDDDSVLLSEIDIKWDTLELCFGIDIPEICVGGFCIIPTPWGCALRAPKICAFSDNPDISFCLELGGLITSEVSGSFTPLMKYRVDPGRTAAMNDWDARDANVPSRWQAFINPVWVDVDLIDIADTVGDLLDGLINAAVDGLLGFLPGWARDLIKAILGPVVDLVRDILDIGDDLQEWLSDLLGTSLGLFNMIAQLVADYFANKTPLLELEDPYPAMKGDAQHVDLLIPIEFLGVRVNTDELILEGDIGGVP
jgi:hypothetical protein